MAKEPAPAAGTLPASIVKELPIAKQIADLVVQINALLPKLEKQFDASLEKGVERAARAFVVFHRLHDRMDALDKGFGKIYEAAKKEKFPTLLDDHGLPHVALTEGFRVGISSRVYASIPEANRDACYKWLRENDLGALIIETVNASTLSGAVRELRESNIDVPEIFTVADVPTTTVNVAKPKGGKL